MTKVTWTCPSCGQGWPEKPLVDGTVGCPECGNVAARALLAFPPPDRTWKRAYLEDVAALQARVEAAENALQAYEMAVDRHDLWCGHRAEAPGDGSLNHARRLAREVLAAAPPVPETPQGDPGDTA